MAEKEKLCEIADKASYLLEWNLPSENKAYVPLTSRATGGFPWTSGLDTHPILSQKRLWKWKSHTYIYYKIT